MKVKIDKDEILIIFCIIDDIIKALGMQGEKQQEMSESEVLTVAWISHSISAQTIKQPCLSLGKLTKTFFQKFSQKVPLTEESIASLTFFLTFSQSYHR